METVRIQNGDTERIECMALDNSGSPLTGLSDVYLRIRRVSDGFFLDFDDGSFKGSGWVVIQTAMIETDQTNDPGRYHYDFDTAGFADDDYQVRVNCSSAANFPQVGEVKAGGYVDDIVTIVTDVRRVVKNKLTIDEGNSKLQLWNDAGENVILEWLLTDKDGAAISLSAGLPANRGVGAVP